MLNKIWLAFCAVLLGATITHAQGTPKPKASLNAEVQQQLPNNTSGLITPAVMQALLNDLIASWQQYATVNPQAGTSYVIQSSDYGKLVTFSNSGSVAVTIPSGASFTPFSFYASNVGTGAVTLTPITGTINGSSSLSLATGQAAFIVSDGTNWQVFEGSGAASLIIGTTPINSGTNGYVLYDNSGILGQHAPTGTGTSVATSTGALTAGDCVKIGNNLDFIDAGSTCGNTPNSQIFTNPGSVSTLTITSTPIATNANQLTITFDGVTQARNTWSYNGGTGAITFNTNIPANVQVVEADWVSPSVATGYSRTTLSNAITLYVSPSGNDNTGNGTAGSPWKTVAHAYSVLQTTYDLSSCNTVTIQLADGTYTSPSQLVGTVLGQCQPGQLIITGDCTTPTNVLVQPAADTGYAFSGAYGTQYRLQCMELDQSNNANTTGPYPDIVTVGQFSRILLGNPSLFGVRADLVFGCNFGSGNTTSAEFGGYIEFDNDFNVNGGVCQKQPTGTVSTGTNTITSVSSTAGIGTGMGITASGVPESAYVSTVVGSTITYSCASILVTCTSTANASETITLDGGGQTFLDLGNGAQGYFATNGDPSYSIIATLQNFPFYTFGWFLSNDGSSMNAQAITFVSQTEALGGCFVAQGLSSIDTGLQGTGYVPCLNGFNGGLAPNPTINLSSGSATATISSATGIGIGNVISTIAVTTASWSSGNPTLTVASTAGIRVGNHIVAPGGGILAGSSVNGIGSGTISIGGCGAGPRCVGGYPTYANESSASIYVTGSCLPNSTVITAISGTTVTLSQPATCSGSFGALVQGAVLPWYGGIYD